jgi:transcriptional regulator with XRE-family HTH domain
MLRMSAEALAEESGISIATIKKLETKHSQITPRASTMDRLIAVLESHGIEFLGTAEESPGVRLHRPPR